MVAQRAERPTSASAFDALPRAPPRESVAVSLPARARRLALVGSSPETVVKCEGTRAALNPIAGTIAPGDGDAEALLSSEKDRAEHVMLVDLGRNDLSRVCVPGTVHVEQFMQAERYSHVTHLVSEVVGELQGERDAFDAAARVFPAGTVSGAPKVRAMQIISELEAHRRGIYAGAVGYIFPADGSMDTCIAIRTLVLRDGVAYLQAGGGHRRRLRSGGGAPGMPEQARRARGRDRARGGGSAMSMLLVDNYDSFTYNLAHLFGALGVEVTVLRNDEIDARRGGAAGAVASRRLPRSRPPAAAGVDDRDHPALAPTTPTLGVCLGHQAIVEVFGGEVGYGARALHGKASPVHHDGTGLFAGLPEPFEAGRYHSLAATRVPDELEPTAFADDGEVMAVRHRELAVDGVQFHPESVLTPDGPALARNFLEGRL